MAASDEPESKNDEIDQFIRESKLSAGIESGMRDKGLNLANLCSQSEEQIGEIANQLTADQDEQSAFKRAIQDWKAKAAAAKKPKIKRDENGNIIFCIYVTTFTGKTMTFDVTKVMTVADLKQAIHEKENIAVKTQKLMFKNSELTDDKATLEDCSIGKESRLHIILTKASKGCCIL